MLIFHRRLKGFLFNFILCKNNLGIIVGIFTIGLSFYTVPRLIPICLLFTFIMFLWQGIEYERYKTLKEESFSYLREIPAWIICYDSMENIIFTNQDEFRDYKTLKDFYTYFVDYEDVILIIQSQIKKNIGFSDIKINKTKFRVHIKPYVNFSMMSIFDVTIKDGENQNKHLLEVLNRLPVGIVNYNDYRLSFFNKKAFELLGDSVKTINLENEKQIINNKNYISISKIYQTTDAVSYVLQYLQADQVPAYIEKTIIPIVITKKDFSIIYKNKAFKNTYTKNPQTLLEIIIEHQHGAIISYVNHIISVTKNIDPLSVYIVNGQAVDLHIIPWYDFYVFFLIDYPMINESFFNIMQQQRLRSLGETLSSVSHDFNNILTSIIGFSDLLLERFDPTSCTFANITQIKHGASKGANLIKQILNIAKKQSIQTEVLDLHDVITEFIQTFGRILVFQIDILFIKENKVIKVFMNEVNVEQILINLITNARDALLDIKTDQKKIITISTAIMNIPKSFFEKDKYINAGEYVELSVQDNGVGISPVHLDKIFDSFFTTKEEKGTGLGLATVSAIVKKENGFIRVVSQLGLGTTFKIYIPSASGILRQQEPINHKNIHDSLQKTTKRILLVDDDVSIRTFCTKMLKNKGFIVDDAFSALDAINKIKKNHIDLLITDLQMHDMHGHKLTETMLKIQSDFKILYISGYDQPDTKNFLKKPFSFTELYNKVLSLLAE